MRAVLDTNVVVAALLWRGPPHVLLEKVRDGDLLLVSSATLLAELADVLWRESLQPSWHERKPQSSMCSASSANSSN